MGAALCCEKREVSKHGTGTGAQGMESQAPFVTKTSEVCLSGRNNAQSRRMSGSAKIAEMRRAVTKYGKRGTAIRTKTVAFTGVHGGVRVASSVSGMISRTRS